MNKGVKWLFGIIFTVVLERLLNLIPLEKLFVADKWSWIIKDGLSILDVALFFISFILVFSFIKHLKLGTNRKSKLERHLERLNYFIDNENGVKVTWDMYMGTMYDNDPHPYNIKVFCMKHNPPLLMSHGHCQDFRCPNADKYFSDDTIKNQIESLLLAERDKFLNKQ